MTQKIVSITLAAVLTNQVGTVQPLFAQTLTPRKQVTSAEPENQRLGAGDQISLWVRDAAEISDRSYRIEENGNVHIPLVGDLKVGGLTKTELEALLVEKLHGMLLDPVVHVSITELQSSPITITGAVKNPGAIQLKTRMTLLQAISTAGGVAPEAGNLVRVTRSMRYGKIPLSSAKIDPSGDFSLVEEEIDDVTDGTNPAANLVMQSNDIVNVVKAPILYVMGELKRTGGLALTNREPSISVLEALALAEGMTEFAAPKKAVIIRPVPGSIRQSINIDLKAVLEGKAEDLKLRPNDILFVPNNKSTATTIAKAVAQAATSLIIGVTIMKTGRR